MFAITCNTGRKGEAIRLPARHFHRRVGADGIVDDEHQLAAAERPAALRRVEAPGVRAAESERRLAGAGEAGEGECDDVAGLQAVIEWRGGVGESERQRCAVDDDDDDDGCRPVSAAAGVDGQTTDGRGANWASSKM